ncbi:MAG TPA: DRTGG domain-containing protein [Bacillales bacterium]|nr:DRTGG domain-containing protein [Bacillales bacterium]
MATKHEQILKHIEDLEVGRKISVRGIAKQLDVSEGTAYRAIKDAENLGFVSTIERVGTIRIETKRKENFEKLTYAEVVNIVDGIVLGGREGLHKSLNKFVIGAMKLEAMMRYVDAGNLVIVGNRDQAQFNALKAGAAVLITGGFMAGEDAVALADELKLPIISTSYDTFTVAAMINRAIYDQLIKKEIVLVQDILIPVEQAFYLKTSDTIDRWRELNKQTGHSRYPVVDGKMRVQGMVTAKDIVDHPGDASVVKAMTKNPLTVSGATSLAMAAHMMIWEGIELLPVVNPYHKLQGLISRQDVLKALQVIQRQPQVGETIDELITGQMVQASAAPDLKFRCEVTPQMTNYLGSISYGAITTLVGEAGSLALRQFKKGNLVIENITLYFLKPVQIESVIEICPRVMEISRRHGKLDIEVFHDGAVVGKAMMTAQLIDRH